MKQRFKTMHAITMVLLVMKSLVGKTEPPNIIFMMADDLGYNDLACYGQKIYPTPHTDQLANEGIRLTSAYSPSAVCSPTRYAVLTGTDPCRRYITSHVLFNAEPLMIKKNEQTVASLLKKAGYTTGVIGKWHLGLGDTLPRDLNNPGRGANEVGFDYSFLVPDIHNMLPNHYHENGEIVGEPPPIYKSFLTVQERKGGKLLRHKPLNQWEDRRPNHEIGKMLADKADAFLEQNSGRPFFLYYPTCAVHEPYTPQKKFQGKSGIGALGDFVMEFDWMVGRLMAKLDKLKLAENTLLIVTSDNGGLESQKNPQTGLTHRPSDPWRGGKHWIHEGGHRVPFIARWPGHINPGTVSDEMISLVDLTATVAAIRNIAIPADVALDSHNILPVLYGKSTPRSTVMLTTRGIAASALRQKDWKLIKWNFDQKSPELYNLKHDPYETNNLFTREAERAQQMQQVIDSYFQRGCSRPNAKARGKALAEILEERIERNGQVDTIIAKQSPNLVNTPTTKLQLDTNKLCHFKQGVRLFTDRHYAAIKPPQILDNAFFLRVPLVGDKIITCTTPATLWIATPSPLRHKDSQERILLAQGFKKKKQFEFALWSTKTGNLCSLYIKHCNEGDVVKFGYWALPIFFSAAPKTDQIVPTERDI